MKTGYLGVMTAAAALAVSLPLSVSAQQSPPTGAAPAPAERMDNTKPPSATAPGTTAPSATAPGAMTSADMAGAINSDDLIGKKVKNSSDETVGSIDALLVSKDARVVGVVLDVGGFLGVGGKKVVVPMNQLSVAGRDDVRIPTASKEQLQQAPAYERPKS
jgi:hypothetical protein